MDDNYIESRVVGLLSIFFVLFFVLFVYIYPQFNLAMGIWQL